MQNLLKLSILTITFFCANYFSTMAQDEQKAFKEGDKVISIGIAGGFGSSGYSKLTPSISFDYGLKGTRGIVSIGGFLSYSNSTSQYSNQFSSGYGGSYGGGYGGSYFGGGFGYNPSDTTTHYTSYSNLKKQSITAGIRLGLHYSTRKWDLYAGAMIGYQFTLSETNQFSTTTYKYEPNAQYPSINTTSTSYPRSPSFHPDNIILSPYAGARYYVTKKVSLNLEVGQHTGNIGIGFKF
jgi:hypothetical protein